jgi:hypothetical protein
MYFPPELEITYNQALYVLIITFTLKMIQKTGLGLIWITDHIVLSESNHSLQVFSWRIAEFLGKTKIQHMKNFC